MPRPRLWALSPAIEDGLVLASDRTPVIERLLYPGRRAGMVSTIENRYGERGYFFMTNRVAKIELFDCPAHCRERGCWRRCGKTAGHEDNVHACRRP